MRRTRRTLVLAAWIAASTVAVADAGRPARLELDPPALTLAPGERRLVVVRVADVPDTGLAAFQVTVEFDPRTVQVADPNGSFVGAGVPTFAPLGGSPLCAAVRGLPACRDPRWLLTETGRRPFGTSGIDGRAGRVTIGFATAGDAKPPAGSGALALIEVIGTGGGRTSLHIAEAILADAADPPRRHPHVTGPANGPVLTPPGVVEIERDADR